MKGQIKPSFNIERTDPDGGKIIYKGYESFYQAKKIKRIMFQENPKSMFLISKVEKNK